MAGMEACLVNLIEAGDRVVIGVNGFFGLRLVEISRRLGAEVTVINGEWGRILEPEMFSEVLSKLGQVKLVACVHAETSTGVATPLAGIAEVAHTHGAVFLADMGDFGAMNAVYARFMTDPPPARSTVQAARLPRDARVEIDAIAYLGR